MQLFSALRPGSLLKLSAQRRGNLLRQQTAQLCRPLLSPDGHGSPGNTTQASAPAPTVPCSGPQQQRQRCVRAAAAAAVVPAAASASFPALQNSLAPVLPYLMATAAACCASLVALMVVVPDASITQRSVRSNLPLVLLGVVYGAVLLASWSPDTLQLMMPGSLEAGLKGGFNPQFFPTLESVQALFGRPFTAASFLLHVLAINLIAARSAFIDGINSRIPTVHSVLLCSVVGPLGLLCHQLTKGLYKLAGTVTGKDLRPAAKPHSERSKSGTITIMPYE